MEKNRAAYSNHTHLLLVSVSRHLYFDRREVLQYQEKPLEVNINNYRKSGKAHLVYYILLDSFSGNFLFSVASSAKMLPLVDFLHFGWNGDEGDVHFQGMPRFLSVPKRIASPRLLNGLENLDVQPFHPSSGFSSGIHLIRLLENNICYFIMNRSSLHFLHSINECKPHIYNYLAENSFKENLVEKWREGLPSGGVRPVPGYESLIRAFSGAKENEGTPALFASAGAEQKVGDYPPPLFLTVPLESVPFSTAKLHRAEEMVEQADCRGRRRQRGLKLVYRALELSPHCVEALNYLALRSDYCHEQLLLFQRGVEAGRKSLGSAYFNEHGGSFYSLPETRPFMLAMAGLAQSYWETGRRDEAIEIYWEMLHLNPRDNQGIRYALAFRLLEEKRQIELGRLFDRHDSDNEPTCFMLYNKALYLYRIGSVEAEPALLKAIESNRHVFGYLSGELRLPYLLPGVYRLGDEDEAIIYAVEAGQAWRETPQALEWFRQVQRSSAAVGPVNHQAVTIEKALQDYLEDRVYGVKKVSAGRCSAVLESLEDCFERYGAHFLSGEEREFYEQALLEGEEDDIIFCRLFGPDKIAFNISEYVGYYLPLREDCDRDFFGEVGTVLTDLAGWLLEKGFIESEDRGHIIKNALVAARELPAVYDFSAALCEFIHICPPSGEEGEELDHYFEVTAVEDGILHLEAPDREGLVSVAVPVEVSRLCRPGWIINLLLIKTGRGWEIAEAGGVLPA